MLLSTDAPRRGRYILLSTLSPHVPVEKILELSPQLPKQLMSVMGHQALACHVSTYVNISMLLVSFNRTLLVVCT